MRRLARGRLVEPGDTLPPAVSQPEAPSSTHLARFSTRYAHLRSQLRKALPDRLAARER